MQPYGRPSLAGRKHGCVRNLFTSGLLQQQPDVSGCCTIRRNLFSTLRTLPLRPSWTYLHILTPAFNLQND